MSTVTGSALYKKKAGMISILEEETPPKLVWKCIDSSVATPIVEILLDQVANLQATSKTSEKMVIVIGLAPKTGSDGTETPGSKYAFAFNNRVTMDNVKVTLQQVIARRKSAAAADATLSTPANNNSASRSATPAPNLENVQNDEFLANLLDVKQLLKNLTLQQKLLRDNPSLMRTFADAVIKSGLEPEEFWSTRVHLLRSYAIQNNQKRGPYNVLSTIKPVASSENQVNVSVTREKIHEIFQQYPIVRKAYDDTVPKISEGEFWSRFFSSKLFRKLRGEKVNLYDRGDITLDKYLYYDPDYDGEEEDEDIDKLLEEKDFEDHGGKKDGKKDGKTKRKDPPQQLTTAKKKVRLFDHEEQHVSKCIDVLGNEEDNSQKLGNAPDLTMKQDQSPDLVNILRAMNRLSRRMMTNIKDPERTDHLDDEFEQELDIRDLENKDVVEYNELKYTQRSNISSNIIPAEILNQLNSQSPLNPTLNPYDEYMKSFKTQFNENSKLELTSVYVENKRPLYDSYKEILNIIKKNSKQSSQSWNSKNFDSNLEKQDASVSLSADRVEALRLTHSTSVEFLRHFWLHFNSISNSSPSTNPNFKTELIQLRKLYFSLSKCLDRVNTSLSKLEPTEKESGTVLMDPLVISLNSALKSYRDVIVESK